jgi:hypothetical protein
MPRYALLAEHRGVRQTHHSGMRRTTCGAEVLFGLEVKCESAAVLQQR